MEFLRLLAEYRTPWLTSFFSAFTVLGEEVFAISIICLLYWCYDKKLAKKICIAYFASGLTVQALKLTFCIPRPWVIDPSFQPVDTKIASATGYSFPSGHTQSSSALFGSCALLSKKIWLRIIPLFLMTGVAFSRMYLGYHTPKDVLTAMFLSLFIVLLVNKVIDVTVCDYKKVAVFLAVFSFAVLVYSLILKNLPNADITQFHDCFKAAGAGLGFALGWYVESRYINFNEKSGSPFLQVVKLGLGLLVAILLKSGLKMLLGTSLTADTIRYFILVCWIMILYPVLIVKLFNKKQV
ncbi:phosphatase PAP2 family protein [Konateibacter massiliensis]|uniref:phosphatase PAP2 family protein n=1 Tax=Konateibacter massiliensis TaxID=2002841 RepID=UPI000C15D7D1|nr:phosphatase PAP2 family protein [Konateibacter massiliensis]